jgi:glycosyltransferase involved in cell wall biosynthesis
VCFAGYQRHPEACLRLMDVFALTSRSEGMPVAMLEAWAAGIPVVASRVGGIPELVREGHNGLLFDFPDVPALANALEKLIKEPGLARTLGGAGREEVRARFSVGETAGNYDRLYGEIGNMRKVTAQCVSSS